ncbi:hypothetical protein [Algoriphagus sp.]|nr:hypothetical protein [Algoriphagus sp.]
MVKNKSQNAIRQAIWVSGQINHLPRVGGLLVLDFINTVNHWNPGAY